MRPLLKLVDSRNCLLSPAEKKDFKDEQYPPSHYVDDCARKDCESPVG